VLDREARLSSSASRGAEQRARVRPRQRIVDRLPRVFVVLYAVHAAPPMSDCRILIGR
jgi:hypothetical protein